MKDHRELGRELDLFVTSDLVGSGLPLFTPKGTILRDLLIGLSEKLQRDAGYQKVWIPHIAKEDLYKNSGHWDKFGGELFKVQSQETDDKFILKPMNCPHHIQIYASNPRSYRELPVRYYESSTVYRDEKSGEIGGGISRVRSITMDDAHIFCRFDQVEQELDTIIGMVKKLYKKLDMQFHMRLSFRDPKAKEKYLGSDNDWKTSQSIIENVAKKSGHEYVIAEGEAAFYAPKIDIMVKDSHGKDWQVATEQLDLLMPERFKISYIDEDGSEKTPVMIHKALLGAVERFLAVYIEHTQGAFPLWLAPLQIAILPVSEKHVQRAKEVASELKKHEMRVEVNAADKTLGAKIREATLQKVPFMIIIGDKEVGQAELAGAVRTREGKDLGPQTISEFIKEFKSRIETV